MGYAATTIVMYGVQISEEVARQIKYNELHEEDGFNDETMYDNCLFRKTLMPSKYPQQTPITPYAAHAAGNDIVFYPEMLADGIDSRLHSRTYEPGTIHYLGIYIASKGYAANDDINYFMNNVPQEAIDNFNNSLALLLKKYGVTDEPELVLVNQMR